MYAIIEIGGKQHKIEKKSILEVNLLAEKEGEKFTIDKVLLLGKKDSFEIGTPLVKGAKVEAKVLEHLRGDKITVFKMKAKKRYKKTQGHRQELSKIEILEIKES